MDSIKIQGYVPQYKHVNYYYYFSYLFKLLQ